MWRPLTDVCPKIVDYKSNSENLTQGDLPNKPNQIAKILSIFVFTRDPFELF